MKIGLFCDNFYPTIGGTETAVKELANALSKEHDVCVATIKGKQQKPDEQLFDFKVERTLSLKVDKNNYLALPQLDRKFKKKMEQMDFDVIHCHSTANMAYFGLKLAKKKKIPFVITVHTKMKTAIKHHVKVGFVVNWLVKKMVKLLNKADAVYTVGEIIANELKEYGYNGKVEVVRN
ncbi:MAG: glycosyltransferase, partial [Clostridia bacterium]|nr:glycosyltransferase [Clostridia bacterium]